MSKNNFQNGLLKRSRRNLYYIGSCSSGFFLIENQKDVDVANEFYQQHVGGEQANWDALLYLAAKAKFKKTGGNSNDTGSDDKVA